MRGVAHIGFGRSGNSFQHLVTGWSNDDGTRSWTIGHESMLRLPRPRQRGAYMLCATGMAFTAPKYPHQRLIIYVNGAEVGRFLLNGDFKIESVVPWNVLANASDVVIAFRHPDAVRPCDVGTVNDARWIAIGLDELTLRVAAPHEASTFRAVKTAAADALPSPVVVRPAHFGPTNVPFRPLPSDWLSHPIFVHFMDAVAWNPDKVAIDDGVQALSFAEALQHASVVSARIVDLTVPGARIAICVPHSTWAAIAILACLCASRRFTLVDIEAIDISFPALAPDLAIVLAAAPELPSAVRRLVLPVAPETSVRANRPTAIAEHPVTLARSRHGWVGKSEPALLLEIARCIETSHFNDSDKHLSLAPLSAVDGLRDMLAALLTGGTVYLSDSGAPMFDQLAVMRHAPVTICAGPISAWLSLARQPHARRSLRAMRLIRADATPLFWSHVAVLRSVLPGDCHILHGYGTVETSTCIQHFVTTPSADAGDIVPAGFALPGFTLAVVDPSGSGVADGELGELVACGPFMQRSIGTGQMMRRRGNGCYEFSAAPDVPAVAPLPAAGESCRDSLPAVRAAWRAVLGTAPTPDETFTEAGGDSLKLLEFAVELERSLGRRLPMSLFALRMCAAELAAAVASSGTVPDASSALPPHELMQRFENLGWRCELAWVQRHCHTEPYSLFRFAGTTPEGLIAALESSFEGLAHPATLDIRIEPDGEYFVEETRFGFTFHTDIKATQIGWEEIRTREAKRLRFLAERMIDNLSRGEKIFVYRSRGPAEDGSMLAMHESLARYGRNKLMWVVSADAENRIGDVRKITEDLLVGYVDPLAMAETGQPVLVDSWLQVCATAYRMLMP